MFVFIKKSLYLVIAFCLFFVSSITVKAITFFHETDDHNICYDKLFEPASTDIKGCTYIKHSNAPSYGYCGSQQKSFNGPVGEANEEFIYIEDSSWSEANNCRYYVSSGGNEYKLKDDGKCSAILGYIIKNAEAQGYMRTQGAVWTYLSIFANSPYSDYNTSGGWDNPAIRDILFKAWKEYLLHKEAADAVPVKNDNLLSLSVVEGGVKKAITGDNIGLYYVPSNDSCGTGKYMSGKIIVANKSEHTLSVKFSSNKNVKILINGFKQDSIVLDSGDSSISVATVQIVSKYRSSEVNLNISASYEGENVNIPDTVRYLDGKDSVKNQTMFILKNDSRKSIFTFKKTFKLDFAKVGYKHCDGVDSNNPVYPKYYTNDTQEKKCANNVASKEATIAHFSACTCIMVPVGDNKKVGVTLKENVRFYFGNFAPSFVYPGGGFSFYTQDPGTNGNASAYYSDISWDFVDKYNGVSYYNKDNSIGNASELVDEVNEFLIDKLSGKSLTLNIDTEDSNISTFDKKKNYNYKLNLDINDIPEEFGSKYLKFGINPIEMEPAYFSKSGVVSYNSDLRKYPIDGGNKYYVPLNYTNGSLNEEEKFNFNITNTNLSLSGYFSFNYSGQCYEPVKTYDLKSNLNYRPISEANPFPNNVIAANWKEWYDSDTNNLLRLKNSFSSDKLLYLVNLNANNISSVLRKYNKVYTNWDYVGSNGKDQLVNDNNLFTQRAKSDSYCAIGTFDSKCDK